jgi:tetratricopeptide (TPR) repeat protein
MPRLLLACAVMGLAACDGAAHSESVAVPLYRQPLTGAALEHYERGQAADRSSDYMDAAAEYAKAIQLAPHHLAAHEAYSWAAQNINRQHWGEPQWIEGIQALDAEYASMMESDPSNAILPYIRGKLWFYDDREKSREMLMEATRVDPGFAPAWSYLATHAEGRGDKEQVRAYRLRALEADPSDPAMEASIVYSYGLGTGSSWSEFRSRGEAFVERHLGSLEAARMLVILGDKAPTPDEAIRYYRQNIEAHPLEEGEEQRNRPVASAYFQLYRVLQEVDPEAAAMVMRDAMRTGFMDDWYVRIWPGVYQRQVLLNLSRTLRQAGETDAALGYVASAQALKGGWYVADLDRAIEVEHALVLGARGEAERSRGLLLDVLAHSADAAAEAELGRVMAAEGATRADILEAIWTRRLAEAKPAAGLGLPDLEGRIVELEDFRGQVVLLNLWYPACGPCRVEFPYLAAAVDRFADRGLVTLAANVHPAEAAEAGPFMENAGYPFRVLQTDAKWAEANYGVRGYPANFIIDPEGRIIHDPGIISSPKSQAAFERWMESFYEYLESRGQAGPGGTGPMTGGEG